MKIFAVFGLAVLSCIAAGCICLVCVQPLVVYLRRPANAPPRALLV